jgi:hypothetical protein
MPCNRIAKGAMPGSCYCFNIFNLETVLVSCILSQAAFVSSHPLILLAIPSQKPKEGRTGALFNTPLPLDTTGLVKYICFLD